MAFATAELGNPCPGNTQIFDGRHEEQQDKGKTLPKSFMSAPSGAQRASNKLMPEREHLNF